MPRTRRRRPVRCFRSLCLSASTAALQLIACLPDDRVRSRTSNSPRLSRREKNRKNSPMRQARRPSGLYAAPYHPSLQLDALRLVEAVPIKELDLDAVARYIEDSKIAAIPPESRASCA